MTKGSAREPKIDLVELEDVFERSILDEVPTYAPAAFAKAADLRRAMKRQSPEQRSAASDDQSIERANAALHEARQRAKAAEPHLADLIQVHSRAVRSHAIGYHAPEVLRVAEERFWEAVSSGEAGDFAATRRLAKAAESKYAEATLVSLERGPLRQLASEIDSVADLVGPELQAEAAAVLAGLHETTRSAKAKKTPLASVRQTVERGTSQIRRLIDRPGADALGGGGLRPPVDPGPGWAPGTFEPPEAPMTMRIGERTADALTVSWIDRSSMYDLQILERSIENGPFEAVAELGPSVNGRTTYQDTGLSPDTLHRYRVRVSNEYGSNVTRPDNMAVGHTKMAEDLAVWRVQLYVRVADVSDAGTDNGVQVRLQSPLFNYAPNGNRTWLDHAPRLLGSAFAWEDDFDRGSEFLYDIRSLYVDALGDITMLTLHKDGTDAIGIAEFALLVNGREVFRKRFGESRSTCLWLDEGDGHNPMYSVYHPELRASAGWQSYVQSPPPPPREFLNAEIVSRFEGVVGHALHGTPARWRSAVRPVRVTKASVETETFERLRVNLLLVGDVDIVPDPNVSLTFDLQVTFSCNPQNPRPRITFISDEVHASASFDAIVELLLLATAPAGLALLVLGKTLAVEAAESNWQRVTEEIVLRVAFCPGFEVNADENGDASIRFLF
jgi:hypothetical protein